MQTNLATFHPWQDVQSKLQGIFYLNFAKKNHLIWINFFAVFWSRSFCSQIMWPRPEQNSRVAWLMDELGKKFVRLLFNIVYMVAIWHRTYYNEGFSARNLFRYCLMVYFIRTIRFYNSSYVIRNAVHINKFYSYKWSTYC